MNYLPITFSPMLFVGFLPFIIFHFSFCTASVKALDENENALFALVKGTAEFEEFCGKEGVTDKQSKEILSKNYGTDLGILYYLKQNWHCKEINSNDRKECDHNRKRLDILYEYLYNVHAVFSAERSMLGYNGLWGAHNAIKALFINWKLMKEKGDQKLIVFDITPYGQKNNNFWSKIFEGGDKLKHDEFDKIMEQWLKKAEERAAIVAKNVDNKKLAMSNASSTKTSSSPSSSTTSSSLDNRALLLYTLLMDWTPIYHIADAEQEEQILSFLQKCDFDKIVQENNTDKQKNNYDIRIEAVVVLYMLRKHWQCANAKQNEFFDKAQCDTFRQYLDILHEFLFRLHHGLATGKARPIFRLDDEVVKINKVVDTLNRIGVFYFGEAKNFDMDIWGSFPPRRAPKWTYYKSLRLLNEEKELDYLKEGTKTPNESSTDNAQKPVVNGQQNDGKTSAAAPADQSLLRQKFDQQLAALSEMSGLKGAKFFTLETKADNFLIETIEFSDRKDLWNDN